MIPSKRAFLNHLALMSFLICGCQNLGFIDTFTPTTYTASALGARWVEKQEELNALLLGRTLEEAREIMEARGYVCVPGWDRMKHRLTRTPDAEILLCLKKWPSTDPPEGEMVIIQAERPPGHPPKVLGVWVAPEQPRSPL
jgi:hypothetical protein